MSYVKDNPKLTKEKIALLNLISESLEPLGGISKDDLNRKYPETCHVIFWPMGTKLTLRYDVAKDRFSVIEGEPDYNAVLEEIRLELAPCVCGPNEACSKMKCRGDAK